MLCTFLSASRDTAPSSENVEVILIAVNKHRRAIIPMFLGLFLSEIVRLNESHWF